MVNSDKRSSWNEAGDHKSPSLGEDSENLIFRSFTFGSIRPVPLQVISKHISHDLLVVVIGETFLEFGKHLKGYTQKDIIEEEIIQFARREGIFIFESKREGKRRRKRQ